MSSKHPRFGSLSQAVRAGVQIVPDTAPSGRYFGVSPSTGRLGCDALAAAWLAEYYDGERTDDEEQGLRTFLSADLADAYPVLHRDLGRRCPAGADDPCPHPDVGRTLEQKIIHLEDRHDLSREQVADWLQDQGF